MSKLTEVVNLVEVKLKKLLDVFEFLKEENEYLHQKIAKLEHQLAKEKQSKIAVEENYQSLKVAKTIEGSKKDKRVTKLKINALIREIDKCILQLNEKDL